MIAMQYSFTLPADYDMGIIDRRIAEKGHLLDNYPHLRFKAYLSARRTDATRSRDNLYAPFYLWDDVEGLNNFLGGDGFAGVSGAFGRPQVKSWFVWQAFVSPDVSQAAGGCYGMAKTTVFLHPWRVSSRPHGRWCVSGCGLRSSRNRPMKRPGFTG
jgi:Domain of unknown function (DUF4865)